MEHDETITQHLKRRLREVGSSHFDEIANETGVTPSFIRKFVWGTERDNPRVNTIEPLLKYFEAVDRAQRATAKDSGSNAESKAVVCTPTYTGPERRAAKEGA